MSENSILPRLSSCCLTSLSHLILVSLIWNFQSHSFLLRIASGKGWYLHRNLNITCCINSLCYNLISLDIHWDGISIFAQCVWLWYNETWLEKCFKKDKKSRMIRYGAHMLSRFSCVSLLGTLWTVAHKAPLSMDCPGNKWVAKPSYRAPSWPKDRTHIS